MKTISARQTGVMASLLLFANKLLVLPSLLYEKVRFDGFFVILILLAMEEILLGLFLRLKKLCPSQSFYDIIKAHLGAIFAKIFFVLIALYFFYKIMLLFNICYMYFHMQVYLDASYFIFIVVVMLVVTSSVLRGIRPIARGCEFFYTFIIASLIFCLALSLANFKNFPLFFDSNPNNFFPSIYKHLFCFGDMLIFFVIMDKCDIKKGEEKKILGFFSVSALIIALVYFMFYSAFGNTSFIYKNAISDLITFSYRFIDLGRMDIIAITAVMFLSLLQLSIYAYAFCECFMKIFSKLSVVYSICFFNIAFFGVVITSVVNYLVAVDIGTNFMTYLCLILQILLPILITILCERRAKHEKIS